MADTLEIINCPVCGKAMHKIYIPEAGINIDICLDGCGGMFFDNKELKMFDEQSENIDEILQAIDGKEFEEVDDNIPIVCPVCGTKMVKNYSGTKQAVMVDECYVCGGKFMNKGELEKFRAEFATEEERSEAAIQELYNAVGVKLKAIEAEQELARSRRSPLYKLFRAFFT